MILELVNEKVIQLNVKAESGEEAIRKAGKLLVNTGKVNESYVDGMVEMSKSIKGYIVLAPGIAMPHARPECGVNSIGISILTLEKPIEFGNIVNDPVSLVIALAAKDNKTHIELLQELSVMLDSDNIVKKFTDCTSKEEVMNIIKEFNM